MKQLGKIAAVIRACELPNVIIDVSDFSGYRDTNGFVALIGKFNDLIIIRTSNAN